MGGFGSGSWYRWDSKITVEGQPRIDIRWFKKKDYFRPGTKGSLSWSRGDEQTGSVGFEIKADQMYLNYLYRCQGKNRESIEQIICFDHTTCNFGGQRRWFICPRCWRRVAILYCAGKYFFCRHCYCLAYSSQQESKADRLMRKSQKIRVRLGAMKDLTEPVLVKPKNMHWKTFDRLEREAEEANSLAWAALVQRFGITNLHGNGL